jgi:hypothetical protein
MRYLYQLMCAVVVIGLVAASAGAQQGGGGQGGGGQGGGGQGGGGQGGGGQGGGGQGGGGQGGTDLGGTTLTQQESAPNITAPGTTGGGASSAINASNVFSATYGNPLYQGTPTNAKSNAAPGGFGTTLYPTAAGNAAGGRGAAGAGGARGGAASTANQFGIIISLPVQVSYPAVARFPAAPMTTTKLQTDLAGMIGRSTMIANPTGIQVITEGNTVTLRGTAKDADEARMIAGMVRMTPGVRGVNNELNFPQP